MKRSLAAIFLMGTALPLLTGQSAYAECIVVGSPMADASNPMNGQTITCADNLDNDGVVNRQASDVTVNITAPAGGISVTGQAGVALGENATVTVAGGSNRPINTSGDNAPGISVGNGANITVDGQVTTSGGTSGAIETGDMSTVNVTGTVRTGGGMSDAISVGGMSTINVNTGARIATGNSNSAALVLTGDGSTINVEADADVTTSSGMSNPILVQGNDGTVNISGDVRSSSGNATAVLLEGDGATVTVRDGGFVTAQSSGSNGIESTGSGATIRVERGGEVVISSGNSSAIVSGEMGTVEIAGEVSASSSSSQGVVLNNGASLTIEDMGVITTSSSESQAVLVAEDAMTATINVLEGGEIDAVGAQAILDRGMTDTTVTVDGYVFGGSSDPVIDLGAGDDTVIVNGTVEGSSASPVIDLGDGTDTLTINSSTTVTGPDVLGDLGAGMMDTLNLNSGQMFTSSQFRGAETVNTRRNDQAGDPNNGMATDYTVNDDQSGQTVNASGGSSVNVAEGGTVGTINNDGGQTSVDSGGSATNTNSSNGGSTDVNSGGMVMNANADAGGTTNVNNGGSVMNASSTNGGSTNVNSGGSAMNTSAGSGGSVTVGDGGNAGSVRSDAGGNVTVQSGGSADVNAGSGNGGALTFESGSNANVEGGGTGATQTMQIAGADFQAGSGITVSNSLFLDGSAAGDTMTIQVRENAFTDVSTGLGVTNKNSLNATRAFDAIAQGQTDATGLNALGGIILADAADLPTLLRDATNEGAVQTSVGAVQAAQGFTDLLRAGANPLSNAPVRVAGPALYPGDTGKVGIWGALTFADLDVEADGETPLDLQSFGYAAGVEGRIDMFGFDEAAVGAGLAYTFTDANSVSINDGDVESWSFGAYAGGTKGAVRTDAALAYTNSDIQIVGDSSDADVFTGRIEVAVDMTGDANMGVNISPFVRAEGTLADIGDFRAAGTTGTVLTDGELEQAVLGAGARLGYSTGGSYGRAGSNIRLSAEAAYERVIGDRDIAFAASLGQTANAFGVTQTVADKDRLHAGVGVGTEIANALDVALRYDGRFGSDVTDHRASLRVGYRF